MSGELSVLSAVVEADRADLPPQVGRLIQHAPETFDDGRAGQIAVTVRVMRNEGEPVSFLSISEKHPQLFGFITTELAAESLPLASAEFYAEKCWQAYQVRRLKSIGAELAQSVDRSPGQAQAIIAATRAALDTITSENENGLPALVDAADFLAEPIDPPAELIEGILHMGSKLTLGGSSKSYKTWCLLDLAISVATGTDWLGHRTAQGKVLFINFEIQPHAWQRRIVAVAKAKGVQLKAGQVILLNLRGHAAEFRKLIPKIIERCRTGKFALIVLDPIYKLYGGTDENAAGDVAALLNELERLATATGAAVAFGAHFAKGNASAKEAIDRISGSGVFARDPDSLLIFTKHEEVDAFTIEPILRDFPPAKPFAVRWQFPLMGLADDLDPAKLKQAGRKKGHDPRKLLARIANNDVANPISVSEWARLAKLPRKTLDGYLAGMRQKNWIKTIGEGIRSKQAITNEGKVFISEQPTGGY